MNKFIANLIDKKYIRSDEEEFFKNNFSDVYGIVNYFMEKGTYDDIMLYACADCEEFDIFKYVLSNQKEINIMHDVMLWSAVRSGEHKIIKILLDWGMSPNAENVIKQAAASRSYETIKLLLENGMDVRGENDFLIKMMAYYGCDDIFKLLMQAGANIFVENNKPLRWAARYGHIAIVKILLENGADVHAKNDYALSHATMRGTYPIVELLLNAGADLHAEGDFALQQAAKIGSNEIAKLLLERGADVNCAGAMENAITFDQKEIVELLLQNKASIHPSNNYLSYSIGRGNYEMVEFLLKNNINGGLSMNEAIKISVKSNWLRVAVLLVENGADVSLVEDLDQRQKIINHIDGTEYLPIGRIKIIPFVPKLYTDQEIKMNDY